MKNLLVIMCLCIQIVPLWGQSVSRTPHGVKVETKVACVELECFSSSIIRVKKYPLGQMPEKQSLSVTMQPEKVKYKIQEVDNQVILTTSELTVSLDIVQNQVCFVTKDGKVLLAEKPSSTGFISFNDAGNSTYQIRQTFLLDNDEAIYGLGQHQQGKMNQRNQTLFLQQANTEICIPLVHSIKGYALFWDNYSPTTFTDNAQGMTFDSEVGDLCDYYFVYGGGADKVVAGLRELTGQAPMFPLWTFGFWQSRERYVSQDELVSVVAKYRDLKVPLDGIIQDWRYWGEDHKDWNAVEFRNPKFPDPKKMMEEVHHLNAHAIISVWPSFGPATGIYADLKALNKLMVHETFPQDNGVKVYDTYDPVARDIYWKYMNKNMFSIGMDGWWLDATEPEHSPAKEGDLDFQTYLGSFRKVRNAFPLVSVGGVYDHQRQEASDKRVFILTRSAFAGQQRYAAQAWSGDVVSDWDVLRNQIPVALNISLTGIPYWNSDIGGFFSGRKFPEGVKDPAFHELYVRWMQFAAFTGMMRSHGTNTPREIFMFGERGYWAFDAQEKMINLRYRLLPYVYSTSWEVTSNGESLMRALFSDFPKDKKVIDIGDEYMFGKSILVAPVTSGVRRRSLYLPEGTQWIDFWTGEMQKGGQEISREAPIDIIPLYVKAGSIVPVGPSVQFATEKLWDDLQVRIYPGADGEFTLYEDENDNYNYEKGKYTTVRMTWSDKDRQLTIHPRQGSYDGMLQNRNFRIVVVDNLKGLGLDNESYTVNVEYKGKKLNIKLP
ncbi:TIM-barrel domain-containing protein [Bacteroides sp.]|uniref:glycoside hydrolase family 31 protein n=1 Tax=Bacteroides sp. TaxID=29523 RepID=UPI003A90D8EB